MRLTVNEAWVIPVAVNLNLLTHDSPFTRPPLEVIEPDEDLQLDTDPGAPVAKRVRYKASVIKEGVPKKAPREGTALRWLGSYSWLTLFRVEGEGHSGKLLTTANGFPQGRCATCLAHGKSNTGLGCSDGTLIYDKHDLGEHQNSTM